MSTAIIRPERSDNSYAWIGTMLSKVACRPVIDNDHSISSQWHPVPTFMAKVWLVRVGHPPASGGKKQPAPDRPRAR